MWWKNRRRLQAWQSALAQHRLSPVASSGFWALRPRLMIRAEPLALWLSSSSGNSDRVLVEIEGAQGFSQLKLRQQILKLWTREIEIGDQAFDDAFLLDGPLATVCALLNETMRRLLVRLSAVSTSLEIGGGGLRAEVAEKELPRVLPLLLDVSRKLAEPVDVKERVTWNARRDPRPGVRLANLLVLVRESPGDPATFKALQRACRDVSPKVRVRAAIELGEEGRETLLKVAEKSGDDAASAEAVAHLGGKLPFETAKRILTRALRRRYTQTALACLEVLSRRRAAAVGTLARVLAWKGELGVAAAKALGATGEAAAEAPLLEALQSEDGDLRVAAAAALGQVGSVEAVQPLKEAAERFWLSIGLRRAARQSIAEIQARLEGASPGQLSLADVDAGQLSLADADAGQLSLAEAETALSPFEAGPDGQPSQRARKETAVRQV